MCAVLLLSILSAGGSFNVPHTAKTGPTLPSKARAASTQNRRSGADDLGGIWVKFQYRFEVVSVDKK
jgi:hypothetical protein